MKVLNLNRDITKILFFREELLILKNSLLTIQQQFTDYDFEALIQGISKEDSIEFWKMLENLLDYSQENYDLLLQKKLIFSIKLDKNNLVLELPYESILGLRDILNEFANNISMADDFWIRVGFDRTKVSSLLHLINSEVVRKMQERKPIFIIHRKSIEIREELNFKRDSLEKKSSEARMKKRCILHSNQHQFSFLLVSMKNRRVSSGIQISIKETSSQTIIAQLTPQLIDNSDLIRFISYLELLVKSEINKIDFLNYTLPTLNSKLKPLFDIQIDSNSTQDLEQELLGIYFKLYIENQDYEINDSIKISEINSLLSL